MYDINFCCFFLFKLFLFRVFARVVGVRSGFVTLNIFIVLFMLYVSIVFLYMYFMLYVDCGLLFC